MAPEQLEGQTADARTDIFAFGAVVYEMVTGNKAFHGTSHASLIGAILKDEPPAIDNSQPLISPLLEHVMRRCLAKDRDERWQSAADLARELKWIAEGRDQSTAPVRQVARWRRRERVAWTAAAGAAMLAAAVLAIGVWLYTSREVRDSNVYRATLTLSSDIPFAGVPPVARLAISPDGRRLVFVARDADGAVRFWIRALETTTAHRLPGTEGAWGPFWSPDSRWIGFFTATDRKLKKIDANGGPAITLCDLEATPGPAGHGGSWNRDGVILFATDSLKGVHRVSASGGAASPVTTLDAAGGETHHVQPFFLSDGRPERRIRDDVSGRSQVDDQRTVRYELMTTSAV